MEHREGVVEEENATQLVSADGGNNNALYSRRIESSTSSTDLNSSGQLKCDAFFVSF